MKILERALRKHPLFNRADQNLTVEEAFEQGGLNYQVEELPVYASDSPNSFLEIPSRKATFRRDSGHVLGVVSNHYEVVQNQKGLEFLNHFFAEGGDDVRVIGSGVRDGGRRVFVSFQLGDTWTLPDASDEYVHTLTWGNGFDGGTAFDLTFREIRLVCTNGMVMSHMRSRYAVKHGSGAPKNITVSAAQKALGFGYQVSEAFEQELEKLYSRAVVFAEFQEIMDQLLPVPEEEGRARTVAMQRRGIVAGTYDGNSALYGTALGVYNAFNELEQWGTGNSSTPESANDRAFHRTFISHFNLSNRALELVN